MAISLSGGEELVIVTEGLWVAVCGPRCERIRSYLGETEEFFALDSARVVLYLGRTLAERSHQQRTDGHILCLAS